MSPFHTITRRAALLALAVIAFSGPGGAARAGLISYVVTANTSAIAGSSGYLDFQFNPATVKSPAATLTVTNFLSDGVAGAVLLPNIGDASGSLPGMLSLDNGTPTNELTQGFTFGQTIQFVVNLSGPAVGSPAPGPADGSTFAFSLLNASGAPLSMGPGGSIVTIDVNGANGVTTGTAYAPISSPGPTATVSPSAVPEPSTLTLMGTGLAAACGWARLRRRAR